MIELRFARGGEREQAGAIWSAVFGDEPAFQRRFYDLCAPEGPLVLLEGGQVRSMLALPMVTLTFPDGRSVRAGYVYALATRPGDRGRGYAALLLDQAAGLLKTRGADCLLTVPAEPPLFRFFGRRGFQPGFFHERRAAAPAAAPAAPVTAEEYAGLREWLLAGTARVTYPAGALRFQQTLCPNPGSGLYRLELNHGPGCASVENWPGAPVVKELLCAPADREQGAGAAAALCGGNAQVRLPAPAGAGTPFGAVRWLFGAAPQPWREQPWGYLGLGFD